MNLAEFFNSPKPQDFGGTGSFLLAILGRFGVEPALRVGGLDVA